LDSQRSISNKGGEIPSLILKRGKQMAKENKNQKGAIPANSIIPKIIKMVRTVDDAKGEPTKADVHPDEVENFKKGGWKISNDY